MRIHDDWHKYEKFVFRSEIINNIDCHVARKFLMPTDIYNCLLRLFVDKLNYSIWKGITFKSFLKYDYKCQVPQTIRHVSYHVNGVHYQTKGIKCLPFNGTKTINTKIFTFQSEINVN